MQRYKENKILIDALGQRNVPIENIVQKHARAFANKVSEDFLSKTEVNIEKITDGVELTLEVYVAKPSKVQALMDWVAHNPLEPSSKVIMDFLNPEQ